jgi:hypothetical protein
MAHELQGYLHRLRWVDRDNGVVLADFTHEKEGVTVAGVIRCRPEFSGNRTEFACVGDHFTASGEWVEATANGQSASFFSAHRTFLSESGPEVTLNAGP